MDKVIVDESLCTGCGLCASNCPEVFDVGDDNIARVKSTKSNSCDLNEIAEQCPVTAILIK